MNIEFHYNITYLIALKAGFNAEQAYIIAYSSQFTDDNHKQIIITNNKNKIIYKSTPTQIPPIPNKEQLKLLPLHHFLPGSAHEISTSPVAFTGVTIANSNIANKLIEASLNSNNLYTIGIASHAYVDTWAHQNFTGTSAKVNSMPGILTTFIPNIGHADALEEPDCLDAIWHDARIPSIIKNHERFFEAATQLYLHYCQHLHPGKTHNLNALNDLHTIFTKIIAPNKLSRVRVQKRRLKVYSNIAFHRYRTNIQYYNPTLWSRQAYEICHNGKYRWRNEQEFDKCHWWKFQEAAKEFQQLASSMIKAQNEGNLSKSAKALGVMAANIC